MSNTVTNTLKTTWGALRTRLRSRWLGLSHAIGCRERVDLTQVRTSPGGGFPAPENIETEGGVFGSRVQKPSEKRVRILDIPQCPDG